MGERKEAGGGEEALENKKLRPDPPRVTRSRGSQLHELEAVSIRVSAEERLAAGG